MYGFRDMYVTSEFPAAIFLATNQINVYLQRKGVKGRVFSQTLCCNYMYLQMYGCSHVHVHVRMSELSCLLTIPLY